MEVCPSGLRSTLGKRVSGQPFRRFESSRFRQEVKSSCLWYDDFTFLVEKLRV